MQCKDIPDAPILKFLAGLKPEWANWSDLDEGSWSVRSVRNAMPPNIPPKLVLAKMGMLIRRGLVSGCVCGCRGDFEITGNGQEWLKKKEAGRPGRSFECPLVKCDKGRMWRDDDLGWAISGDASAVACAAAKEIERLMDQIERLKAERDGWKLLS